MLRVHSLQSYRLEGNFVGAEGLSASRRLQLQRGQGHADQRRARLPEHDEHVPPDPGVAKLWLTNRRPESRKDLPRDSPARMAPRSSPCSMSRPVELNLALLRAPPILRRRARDARPTEQVHLISMAPLRTDPQTGPNSLTACRPGTSNEAQKTAQGCRAWSRSHQHPAALAFSSSPSVAKELTAIIAIAAKPGSALICRVDVVARGDRHAGNRLSDLVLPSPAA